MDTSHIEKITERELQQRIAELEGECNACAQHFARTLAENAGMREALDTFSRAWVISLAPFNYREGEGAAKYIPGGWPTVGEFKAAHEALTTPATTEALERVRREAKVELLESCELATALAEEVLLKPRAVEVTITRVLAKLAAALRGGE